MIDFNNDIYGFSLFSVWKKYNNIDREGWSSLIAINYDSFESILEIDLFYFVFNIKL